MSYQEEAQGQIWDTQERLYLLGGLGTLWCPPGTAGKSCWGEGALGVSASTVIRHLRYDCDELPFFPLF